jgi:NAD(P)-dependent dehydrogenase (short-subunit alcohol dehydrogenase family)
MDPPFDLSAKVALVTGAHRGLGFAIAQSLARAGATVVVNGRNREPVAAAAQSWSHRDSRRRPQFSTSPIARQCEPP